jgi:hypothetical protein
MHSVGPDPARGYRPQGTAACYMRPSERLAGPRPGGLVRWRRGPRRGNDACAPGALTARSLRAVHACDGVVERSPTARWQLADGKVLLVSSRGPQGGRWARRSRVELTRAATRHRGGGGCFGQRCSSVGRELHWAVAIEARPCSVGAKEER